MNSSIRTIFHPTDFSDLSGVAFAHALRIALAARSKLQLLHIVQHDAGVALAFPNVRRLLVQWGLLEEDDPPSEALTKLGLEVDNINLNGQDPAQGIARFLREHPSDLVVIATPRARWCRPLAEGLGVRRRIRSLRNSDVVRYAWGTRFCQPGQRRYSASTRANPG